jgi:hypothetical protein
METIRTKTSRKSRLVRSHFRRIEGTSVQRILFGMVILVLILGSHVSHAQGVGISESSITPDGSAILELKSTTRGFLLPRNTAVGFNVQGLTFYNTTNNRIDFNNGSSWFEIPAKSDNLSVFASTTSAQLAGLLSDETGTGLAVFGTAPTFASTITIGTAGGTTGAANFVGTTSGTVTILPQAAAGTYNFNLPTGAGSSGQPLLSGGGGASAMSFGTLGAAAGGTGQTSYAIGDVLYASAATTLSKLADVAAGSYLRSGGLTTAPLWSTLTLPNAATTGDLFYASGSNAMANLADVALGRVLISGGVGAAPSYSATPSLGVAGSTLGTLAMSGNTSGTITVQPQAAAGTYNFNLPTSAGTAGQPLLSGGGVGAAMTFGTLGVGAGGTGLTSGTSGGILGYTAAGTLASSTLLASSALVIGGGAGSTPSTLALGTGNQIVGMNAGATGHEYKTVTAGTMMTVTNAANNITISANVANAIVASNLTTTVIAPSNVTGMSFSIGANETWSFEFNIDNGCNNIGGVKYAITIPAGGVLNASAEGMATSLTTIQYAQMIVSGTLTAAGFNRVNLATGFTRIAGVVANGGTAGTVQLQFASTTAGQTSTVFTNSYLAARRISP